ncbi:FHA domain-containing protein [Marinactinospora thermotolerans]|uniref:FOG: FHA domain n=1 Tax=Marinactinospora thermotolerans DSM 45154 TaxID=1122192 RepID=A0A1T4KAL6_9ACTN|nr:FHA domain-containing protein [Marinactinospora thermotolerans]SJZ39508.1 FOG: FHA domain [Marinactinospora thermotolerans DSM 45154]
MSSVYCTQCGHAVADDARFCSNCGVPLRRPGQDAPQPREYRDSVGETTSTISISKIQAMDAEADARDEPVADSAAVEALPPGTALLVVKRGPNAGSRFLLDSDLTTAGRHPNSDIFLDDVTVSRRHVEFFRRGSSFGVRDVGSLNGTYVNRERIDEAELNAGDEVQIGKFRLVLLTGQRRG